jgi:hypothetical protein
LGLKHLGVELAGVDPLLETAQAQIMVRGGEGCFYTKTRFGAGIHIHGKTRSRWVDPDFAKIPGDAHGRAPLFRPVITLLPSRHRNKVDRFINRRGIIGLVEFAVPSISPIRAPLDRFRVCLMAEIPARENFKNTKTSKIS